jgi:hypothetical protein
MELPSFFKNFMVKIFFDVKYVYSLLTVELFIADASLLWQYTFIRELENLFNVKEVCNPKFLKIDF